MENITANDLRVKVGTLSLPKNTFLVNLNPEGTGVNLNTILGYPLKFIAPDTHQINGANATAQEIYTFLDENSFKPGGGNGQGVTQSELDQRAPSGGTVGQVLKVQLDGSRGWSGDNNTTYSVISEAEFQQGTGAAGRTISAQSLNRDIAWKVNQPDVITPSALKTDSITSGFRVPRFNSTTQKWDQSLPVNSNVQNGALVQRTAEGRAKIADATQNDDAVALGQLMGRAPILANDEFMVGSAIGNTGRKILPSDVKTDGTTTGNRFPVFNAATNQWISSLAISTAAQGNTIPQRIAGTGAIKAGAASNDDELVTQGQLKQGILITDSGDGSLRRVTVVNGVLTVSPPIT